MPPAQLVTLFLPELPDAIVVAPQIQFCGSCRRIVGRPGIGHYPRSQVQADGRYWIQVEQPCLLCWQELPVRAGFYLRQLWKKLALWLQREPYAEYVVSRQD